MLIFQEGEHKWTGEQMLPSVLSPCFAKDKWSVNNMKPEQYEMYESSNLKSVSANH